MPNIHVTSDIIQSLIPLERDAYQIYEQLNPHVTDKHIRDQLEHLQEDHKRHIDNLSYLTEHLVGSTPQYSCNLKGLFIQGLVALQGLTGQKGVLGSLEKFETAILKAYKKALLADLTIDARDLILNNLRHVHRHLSTLQKFLTMVD